MLYEHSSKDTLFIEVRLVEDHEDKSDYETRTVSLKKLNFTSYMLFYYTGEWLLRWAVNNDTYKIVGPAVSPHMAISNQAIF